MAYVVRTEKEKVTDKDGNETEQDVTKYYPIYYSIENNFTMDAEFPTGEDPDRIAWVNYNIDEGYIPTLYPGDKLIYKSLQNIVSKSSMTMDTHLVLRKWNRILPETIDSIKKILTALQCQLQTLLDSLP